MDRASSILAAVSVGLVALGIAVPPAFSLAGLADPPSPRLGARTPLVRRLVGPLGCIGRTGVARSTVGSDGLERRLELAGAPLPVDAVRGLGVAAGLILGAVGLLGAAITPGAIAFVPVGFLAGARMPSMSLARRARTRQERIKVAVPGMVEVLMAANQAGLGPALAFRRTAEVLGGPMGNELRRAAQEMDLGVPWDAALHRLAGRTDVPSLHRLVAALTRSSRLGTSVATSLRRVADDLRRERRTRAEEMARKAPIKMLFPLVFLILPAFLLLTVGPVLLATLRSLA